MLFSVRKTFFALIYTDLGNHIKFFINLFCKDVI